MNSLQKKNIFGRNLLTKRKLFLIIVLSSLLVFPQCKKNEPSSIWGIVTEAGTDEPLEGVTMILFIKTELITSKTTGQDGRYEFVDLASNYLYKLRAFKEGYQIIETDEFYLPSDHSKKLDIIMLY